MPITLTHVEIVSTAPPDAAGAREVARKTVEYVFESRDGEWSGSQTACAATGRPGGPSSCAVPGAVFAGSPADFGWPLDTFELPAAPTAGPWTFRGFVESLDAPRADATYTCAAAAGGVTCRAALPESATSVLVVQLGPDGRVSTATRTSVLVASLPELPTPMRTTTTWSWTVR